MKQGSFDISENSLGSKEMSGGGSCHVLIYLMNSKRNVRPGKGEIVQGTNKASITMRIREQITFMKSETSVGTAWCFCWFGINHLMLNQ